MEILDIIKKLPDKGKEVFIADTARLIGNISLGDEVSIWFGAVIRADRDKVTISRRSNIQDNAVIHVDPGCPVNIGDECIIGHSAIIHGATLENNVLVGMHATVMNKCHIGEFSIIGAGAVVPEGVIIPPYSLVMGLPAKIIRQINNEQKEGIIRNAESYVQLSKQYLKVYL